MNVNRNTAIISVRLDVEPHRIMNHFMPLIREWKNMVAKREVRNCEFLIRFLRRGKTCWTKVGDKNHCLNAVINNLWDSRLCNVMYVVAANQRRCLPTRFKQSGSYCLRRARWWLPTSLLKITHCHCLHHDVGDVIMPAGPTARL
jgi:hypothetical protein